MDRRESLKNILLGTIAGATVAGAATSCESPAEVKEQETQLSKEYYGRTPEEIKHDKKVMEEIFLVEHELATIAVLCDIILPATATAGSATDAGVPEFIEFIVKDIPNHQLPIRGGLMWLDGESNLRFNKLFKAATPEEQLQIVDDIAYPDPDNKKPEMAYGIKFFNLMRNLTMTGYYTTRMGFDDLGYKGNVPNVWNGVPADVLAEHDVDYEPEWIAKCVDIAKAGTKAEWDDKGNLIT
ncbi:MAG: gluconate 2-dehydrogenase subunit 3 family protein [Bacteroidota bacterium]